MLQKSMIILFAAAVLLSGCSADQGTSAKHKTNLANLSKIGTEPIIVQTEEYGKWDRGELNKLPSVDGFTFDVRSYDLSAFDLSGEEASLEYVDFDTDTVWPDALPESFKPSQIMDTGKNPGLGIKLLHDMGITGKGVNIAIIDQGLLLEHDEYKDNIMLYELLHCSDQFAQMHGPAVTSIAVGKSVGVAPDAKVYYIASTFGTFTDKGFDEDLTSMAQGIRRVLKINAALPQDEKISVVSISKGFDNGAKGAEDVFEAIEEAKKEGVFVITTTTERNYAFNLMGLGRELNSTPEDARSYTPGLFWADEYYRGNFQSDDLLLVPMDSRTYASFTGVSDYAFGRTGGLSWSTPWLAGLYALCVQAKPDITPDEFISMAFATGYTVDLQQEGSSYPFGTIVNPVSMVVKLTQ